MFAEAAAAVFGKPNQHLVAQQEVTDAVNVQQLAVKTSQSLCSGKIASQCKFSLGEW